MKQRGSCDTCGKRLGLLPNGKIPSHLSAFDKRTICKGSNLPPEVEGTGARV